MIPSKTIWLVTYLIFNKKYVSADSLGRNLCRIVFPKRFSPSWVFCAHRPISFSQSVTTGLTSESSRVRLKPISTRCQIEESPSWGVEVMAWRRDRGDYFLTSTHTNRPKKISRESTSGLPPKAKRFFLVFVGFEEQWGKYGFRFFPLNGLLLLHY